MTTTPPDREDLLALKKTVEKAAPGVDRTVALAKIERLLGHLTSSKSKATVGAPLPKEAT